eukprot:m.319851 g.319851  ORF g.319851 m.319851 type:complete len:85 (+) comp23509_c0_seq1:156-410(+)
MAEQQGLAASLGETKLKNVPTWASKNLQPARLATAFDAFSRKYSAQYFKPGRGTPIAHVMLGLGVLGYALSYGHIVHERNRKFH